MYSMTSTLKHNTQRETLQKDTVHKISAKIFMWSPVTNFNCILSFDPRGMPTVSTGTDHYFHTCRPSIRPHF